MLRFNGVDIESIAPIIRNTVAISAPKIIMTWKDNPVMSKATFIRKKYDVRTIAIDLYLPITSADERAYYVNLVNGWASSEAEQMLELPNMPGKYIMAIASKLPSASTREWWEKLSVEFTAGDPFFVDYDYNVIPCGLSFNIQGNDIASAYIESTSAISATDPEWELDADKTIALDGTFAAGTLKVDLDDKMVYLDDVSQMAYVTLASRFFDLAPGIHSVVGSGNIYYKQRWL